MNNEMPWRSGRGARRNLPNRFEPLHVDLNPGDLNEDERRSVDTQFFVDPTKSILSKNDSPDIPFDYSLNPYKGCEHGCPYCYARPSHEYWGLSAGIDFESKIFVKTEAPQQLAETFQKSSWTPQPVSLSGNTDPYQPVERDLEITRGCLKVLLRHRHPVSIVTKSALIRRDVDLLSQLAERNLVNVAISLTSVDDALSGKLEPRAARPSLRLKTIRTLSEAGVPVGILLAPVIPGLNDEEMPRILSAAAENGARSASYVLLRLPGAVADVFEDWIDEHVPDRKSRILGRLRELRDGKLNDSTFGRRFRGQGEWASVLRQLFHSARRSAGLESGLPTLSTEHFRPLSGGQMSLFDA
ncbi:MAG: PA0069 family radical SAM protein [Bacteroidetes bacterium]|jgi:DNA repair photolyase|nr:PA0069 family radical SAM protein [Bacteroidota bacterium]